MIALSCSFQKLDNPLERDSDPLWAVVEFIAEFVDGFLQQEGV
jgi:hypothetical protein